MNARNLIRTLGFLILGAVLFWGIQGVLTKKWYYPAADMAAFTEQINEFYELHEGADVQALYLGASHPQASINPMTIYQLTGITSFNMSTSAQPVPVSYFFLQEALKRSCPKIVLFDVSCLFSHDFYSPWWRSALDQAPLSRNKMELAMEYASHYPEEDQIGAFIGSIFPIYCYHDRWSELRASDFMSSGIENYYSKGSYISSYIQPGLCNSDSLNEVAQLMVENVGYFRDMVSGDYNDSADTSKLYDPTLDGTGLDYLRKMKRLCEQHDAKLVLIKIPATDYPQSYTSAWTRLKSDSVKVLAEQYDLEFLDLLYDYDLGIDWSRDSLDGGAHLNYLGAQKVSRFIADYLVEKQGLVGSASEAYEEDLPIYNAICRLSELQTTQNLAEHLGLLKQLDNVTVFFSACDDMKNNLSLEDRKALNEFGILTDFDSLGYRDAFLAVRENSVLVSDRSSNRRITCEGVLTNGCTYAVSSCGWLAGSESKIAIDGVDYSLSHRGINIVVLDNASGLVLDSVCFDTCDTPENQSAIRNSAKTEKFLREYEQYLMIQDAKNGVGI